MPDSGGEDIDDENNKAPDEWTGQDSDKRRQVQVNSAKNRNTDLEDGKCSSRAERCYCNSPAFLCSLPADCINAYSDQQNGNEPPDKNPEQRK